MRLRRRTVATIAVVCIVLSAGCTGLVFGDTAEFSSSQATVGADGLEETDYEQTGTQEHVIEEDVEVSDVSRTVIVSNWITQYEKSLEIQGEQQDAARFFLVSTPAVEVLGQSFNPVAEMDHEELIEEFESQLDESYDEFGDVEKVDSRQEVVLDQEAEVTTFETSAELEGTEVDLYVHVMTVTHDGDLITAVGAHPAAFAQERSNTYTMIQEIEHEHEDE